MFSWLNKSDAIIWIPQKRLVDFLLLKLKLVQLGQNWGRGGRGMGPRFQNLSSCQCVLKHTDMNKQYLSLAAYNDFCRPSVVATNLYSNNFKNTITVHLNKNPNWAVSPTFENATSGPPHWYEQCWGFWQHAELFAAVSLEIGKTDYFHQIDLEHNSKVEPSYII